MKKMTRAEFRKAFHNALAGIGNDFVNELVRVAPVDTGFLRNSIRYEVDGNKLNILMPDYAFHVEFGTRPHIIRPKTAGSLHWKSEGKDVFRMMVHHPGTEPNPFIRRTINTKLRDIVYTNLKRQLA
jgi:hypothetical protein